MPELMLVLISIVLCVIYFFWSSWNHPTNVLIVPFCCFKNSGGCVNRKKRKTVGSAEPAVFLIRGDSLLNCQSVNMRSLSALAPSCDVIDSCLLSGFQKGKALHWETNGSWDILHNLTRLALRWGRLTREPCLTLELTLCFVNNTFINHLNRNRTCTGLALICSCCENLVVEWKFGWDILLSTNAY